MNKAAGKIAVVGAGAIGSNVAYTVMLKKLAREIVLVNRDLTKARTKTFDMSHCTPLTAGTAVTWASLEDWLDADIVVITVGMVAAPNGTRMDMLKNNLRIYQEIVPTIARNNPRAVIITVTNPADVMAQITCRLSGFPPSRVIGSGCLLDSLRFRFYLGQELGLDSSLLEAEVVGEHGESMVLLWSRISYQGIALQEYLQSRGLSLSHESIIKITEATKKAGFEIRRGNEHSCYGITASIVKIIEHILGRVSGTALVSILPQGEYNLEPVYLSLPVYLHPGGVGRIEQVTLTEEEKRLLHSSAQRIKNNLQEAEALL